ncbi:MAG: hypothetical protein HYX67_03880 [Candidatus Melainabacteria bacterium]|nr:hypothetical protein [Candidatus Melainabacteria bacterium]
MQQHPFEITAVSHNGADGAQQLCAAMVLTSARAAQLAEFGKAAITSTSIATRRTT